MLRSRIARWIAMVTFAMFFAALGSAVTFAAVNQPHMVNARGYLYNALSELNAANNDKGGYRSSAMNLIHQAITAVNNGIQYSNNNR